MTPRDWKALIDDPTPLADVEAHVAFAKDLVSKGDLRNAASVIDRAYGLHPARFDVRELRTHILDRLSVRNGELLFRYIPAGWFSMGSEDGDPDERPVHAVRTGDCDFNRFDEFSIKPFKTYSPNGYGLYAMCGSVWEWTSGVYDPAGYRSTSPRQPQNEALAQVLRGGSWADCAEAVTVSFRMARRSSAVDSELDDLGEPITPNVGFRICRMQPND